MPILIENVKILHLDGKPSSEAGNNIFTYETELITPEDMTIYSGDRAVGLARVTAFGPDLHADVVMYAERLPLLGVHALKIFGTVIESVYTAEGYYSVKGYVIGGLSLYHTLYQDGPN